MLGAMLRIAKHLLRFGHGWQLPKELGSKLTAIIISWKFTLEKTLTGIHRRNWRSRFST
jgi:hypothetical protein